MSWIIKNITKSFISSTPKYFLPQITQVRQKTVRPHYHYWKESRDNPHIARYGYSDPIGLCRGLLPRESDRKYKELPIYRPKDSWSTKRALFGQNDYIDILGDESIHPTRILYNVPFWLRGVRGNEFQVLLRKEKIWSRGIFPVARPTRWKQIKKRIKYLNNFLNRKTKVGMNNRY